MSKLFKNVNSDLKIVNIDAINVIEIHIPKWRVKPGNSSDLSSLNSFELEVQWSSMGILLIPFSNPPFITKTINCTFTLNRKTSAISKCQEIKNIV